MTIPMEPIAYVRGGRGDVRDDLWGDNLSTIELVPGLPVESLDGIDDFSHAEVLFVFDRVSPLTGWWSAPGIPEGTPRGRRSESWHNVPRIDRIAWARPSCGLPAGRGACSTSRA